MRTSWFARGKAGEPGIMPLQKPHTLQNGKAAM